MSVWISAWVDRVSKVLPQAQITVAVAYSGWMSAFTAASKVHEINAERSNIIRPDHGHCRLPRHRPAAEPAPAGRAPPVRGGDTGKGLPQGERDPVRGRSGRITVHRPVRPRQGGARLRGRPRGDPGRAG